MYQELITDKTLKNLLKKQKTIIEITKVRKGLTVSRIQQSIKDIANDNDNKDLNSFFNEIKDKIPKIPNQFRPTLMAFISASSVIKVSTDKFGLNNLPKISETDPQVSKIFKNKINQKINACNTPLELDM